MIKKADILLGIVLFLLCLSSLFLLKLSDENGTTVTISVDGRHYGSYDLSENRRIEIGSLPGEKENSGVDGASSSSVKDEPDETKTGGSSKESSSPEASGNTAGSPEKIKDASGTKNEDPAHSHAYNVVEIRGGSVFMAESSCANQVCVLQGSISRVNQTVVCLPNKVVVSISGPKNDMDSISY